jgi:hypothetical protein
MRATILRLDSADPAVTAEMQLSDAGDRFLLAAGQSATSRQILPRPLRLAGLDPAARYRLRLTNAQDAPPQSRRRAALANGPRTAPCMARPHRLGNPYLSAAGWRRGYAADCKSVKTGSIPVPASKSFQ